MAKTIILHIMGEEPVLAEIEQDPQPSDAFLRVSNMRKRDGKDVSYLASGVQSVVFPWHRIAFVELMPSEEERSNVVDFFRM